MLLNNFFEINKLEVSSDRSIANVQATINPKHPIFEGHFPETPVVPGVCMIQMIKEILSQILQKETMLVKCSAIKLNNILSPTQNEVINFDLKIKNTDENNIHVSCQIYFENTNFCNFKGDFKICGN
jgi:3-hydroxyacyl-[acyl-carrier-protein] dehydratase